MKLKIDWKEFGRRLWGTVKECLGGSLLSAVVASGETRARLGRDARSSRARHGNASPEGCGPPAAVSQGRKWGQAPALVEVSARR